LVSDGFLDRPGSEKKKKKKKKRREKIEITDGRKKK